MDPTPVGPGDICRSVFTLTRLAPGATEADHAIPSVGKIVPAQQHPRSIQRLIDDISTDSPLSITFSGQKNSYAILPPIIQNCPRSYTLTIWTKVESWSKENDTVLFRCHTSHSESIELLIASDDRSEGRCYCSIRVDAGSRVHSEAGGQLQMTPGQWHLLSFSHRCSPYPHPPKVILLNIHLPPRHELLFT